jgi:hypothetical protein
MQQRKGKGPGAADRESVAGQLVGAAERHGEELAREHIHRDGERRGDEQRAARPHGAQAEPVGGL